MGLYIKYIEMPKDCVVCPFGWNGCNEQHDFVYMGSRPDNCPIVEVSEPHGRLIDADVLINDYPRLWSIYDLQRIANAPTIIPAEETE